jgi:hypothetical protein
MSDLEFDALDELYFVQSYPCLQNTLDWEEQVLKDTLKLLLEKGWIKCLKNASDEVLTEPELHFETEFKTYSYLATKEGLLAHNTVL